MLVFVFIFALVVTLSNGASIELNLTADGLSPPQERIVGGTQTDIILHPHQTSIRRKKCRYVYRESKYTYECFFDHDCGGSIIAETVVVTAAHCVYLKNATEFWVVAGTNQRRGSDGAMAPVETIVLHESFVSKTYTNDIALLILAIPLPLNNFTIRAIELAQDEARVGALATVTGWGNTGQDYPDFLREVHVPIITNAACKEDFGPKYSISEDMVCAGWRGVGERDACDGDSGGPLVLNGKLAGIVSWGFQCALPEFPGVYARISHQRSWVLEKMSKYL